ncbi:MAG: Uma2 family endonuclease [Anaerolineae bacterium]|nr:Uma2 family endonuclease [Anaerolineae bacterium]
MLKQHEMTFEEFVTFASLPENEDRQLEFINGEIVEMSPSRTRNSELGDVLVFVVRLFCRELNLPCHTTSGDGAYNIVGNTIAPDFAYKPTEMSDEYPDPVAPLWAVEIISPTDKAEAIREKREIYRRAGILLWEIYNKSRSVDVYAPGKPMKTYSMGDVLDGGNVLPGFTLAVAELFA